MAPRLAYNSVEKRGLTCNGKDKTELSPHKLCTSPEIKGNRKNQIAKRMARMVRILMRIVKRNFETRLRHGEKSKRVQRVPRGLPRERNVNDKELAKFPVF